MFVCKETQKERTYTIDGPIYEEGPGGGGGRAFIRDNISVSRQMDLYPGAYNREGTFNVGFYGIIVFVLMMAKVFCY